MKVPSSAGDSGDVLFVTGATGLLGAGALGRLLGDVPSLRAFVLVRDPRRWQRTAACRLPETVHGRVEAVVGDLRRPGLGLRPRDRREIAASATIILHAAADTRFSQTIGQARAVNVVGTRRVLELAEDCRRIRRVVHVSSAFSAGCATGAIPEAPLPDVSEWVNPYERSKHEAESLVRRLRPDALILRPSVVVFDRATGEIPQVNAAHLALRLLYEGLVPALPGSPDTLLDFVTMDYAVDAIARLALTGPRAATLNLCAGDAALPLGELIETSWTAFACDAAWRGRRVPEPTFVDPETFQRWTRLAVRSSDPRLRGACRILSAFVLQLAFPKRYLTERAVAAIGRPPAPVSTYWPAMVRRLVRLGWSASRVAA